MPRADGSPTIAELLVDEDNQEMHLSENITFKKTGKDIIDSLNKKVAGLQNKGGELLGKIETICKARELDPQEVVEAGEDAEKVATYSNKMSSSVGNGSYQNVPKTIIEALQADINNLRVYGAKMARIKGEIAECDRVKNNLDSSTNFNITYDELSQLGF